ncbi:LysR family transcriptional regulator (plasmid) [Enterobacteriaceae bacterium Kacie_13]|nr:LysR family transcriptional regulator [Enterobacteriaceae bacterium Kacie_13]
MNLRLLHAFVMLAEKENYADAADALAISQPALTKQINLLESTLSVSLFARGRHGTRLTTGGQLLLPEAKKVLKQNAVFLQHAVQVAKGGEGVIAAGFGLSSFLIAPQCIARFRAEYPGVEFRLEDMPSAHQYDMLHSGELQVGFVRVPPPAPLSYQVLFEDNLVLVVPEDNGLSLREWLKKLPLLRLYAERGRGLNAQTDRFLEENRCFASSTQQAEDIQTIVALVIAGIGVALLPQSVTHIAPPGLKIIPLTGSATRWQVGIAWDAQTTDPVRDNFVKMVTGYGDATG